MVFAGTVNTERTEVLKWGDLERNKDSETAWHGGPEKSRSAAAVEMLAIRQSLRRKNEDVPYLQGTGNDHLSLIVNVCDSHNKQMQYSRQFAQNKRIHTFRYSRNKNATANTTTDGVGFSNLKSDELCSAVLSWSDVCKNPEFAPAGVLTLRMNN